MFLHCWFFFLAIKMFKMFCHIKLVWWHGYTFGRSLVLFFTPCRHSTDVLLRGFIDQSWKRTGARTYPFFFQLLHWVCPSITHIIQWPHSTTNGKNESFNGKMRMHNCNKMLQCNKGQRQVKTGIGITNEQCLAVCLKSHFRAVALQLLPWAALFIKLHG